MKGLDPNTLFRIRYLKNGVPLTVSLRSNANGDITIASLSAGDYSEITAESAGCASNKTGPFTLSDPNPPATPVATSNGPVCTGADLKLTATGSSGTYQWTGPAGFTSSSPNPVISNANITAAGLYTVTSTLNGCVSNPASVNVIVNVTPVLTRVGSNSPLCAGNTLDLSASVAGNLSVSYMWSGPEGFTSAEQNPSIPAVTTNASGTYTVKATNTAGGCNATGTVAVLIKPTPKITSAIKKDPSGCGSANGSIQLLGLSPATLYLVKYKRNGIAVSISMQSNANGVLELSALGAATYSEIFTVLNDCSSDMAGPVVLLDPDPPAPPVAGPDQELCSGTNLKLIAKSSITGASYNWNGPAGFTSKLQNPEIPGVQNSNGGIYTVFVTVSGCTSASDTVSVIVHTTPGNLVAGNNGPVCDGSVLRLNSSATGGGILSYIWTGPAGFSSSEQNPAINSVQVNATGLYTVKITGDKGNCSVTGTTNVVVHKTPVILTGKTINPQTCASSTGSIVLTGLEANTNYHLNYKKNGISQSVDLVSAANGDILIGSLTAGTYTDVSVVLNNCTSDFAGPFVLTDPDPPAAPLAASNGPVCAGAVLRLDANTVLPGQVLYSWTGPGGFNSNLKSPEIPDVKSINQGEYFVSVTINNCISPPAKVDVIVNPLPPSPITNSPVTYCIGTAAIPLTASVLPGHSLHWYLSATGGISSAQAPTPVTTVTGTVNYFVSQTSTAGCEGPRNIIAVTVNPDAKAAFSYPADTACVPFSISILNNSPAAINNKFEWYTDGRLIGSGNSFPGFIMNKADDSVKISLIAYSAFGCKPDSINHKFYTRPAPVPSFTLSDSTGCGPLQVTVSNTTAEVDRFRFVWDFGNGQVSNATHPGTITFLPDPEFGDTTYLITLKAFTGCDTIYFRKPVLVKSKPKSLFTPDKSFGCSPMRVLFNNISRGLQMNFIWDFGDGETLSVNNADTVSHVYNSGIKDTFNVKLISINSCGRDSMVYAIAIAPNTIKIDMAVNGNELSGCLPHTVKLINNSRGASLFRWDLGDGTTHTSVKNIDTITHVYTREGEYTVTLFASNGCSDTSTTERIKVFSTAKASFEYTIRSVCAGDSVNFSNHSDTANSYLWNFGDGNTSFQKNPVHFYQIPGVYKVLLTTFRQNTDGFYCSDTVSSIITVTKKIPDGTLVYGSGNICAGNQLRFEVRGNTIDTLIWNFGDGVELKTKQTVVYHLYSNPGKFRPSVILQSASTCRIIINGIDTITVDKVTAGFSYAEQKSCGSTMVNFKDSSQVFFKKSAVKWLFGDGTDGAGFNVSHKYTASGDYNVSMIVLAESGCADTIVRKIYIDVFDIPVAGISTDALSCTDKPVRFSSFIQSGDSVTTYSWTSSVNISGTSQAFSFTPLVSGNYSVQLIAGTVNGCFDTARVQFPVYKTPRLAMIEDKTICIGSSVRLQTSGALTYNWQPATGLSCSDCADPVAAPFVTTNYIVRGTNAEGCFSEDSVLVKVMRPFKLQTTGNDTICIGESVTLGVSGASSYTWSPSSGLNNATISNPVASPTVTTRYRVIGRDENSCFSDTAYIDIAVGDYSRINLGPDLTLPTGTEHVLYADITNAPVKTWQWSPSTDLSCSNCADPVATIKKNITYTVQIRNIYGCPASDTIQIKPFCENAQVFIPNAFTPDGDGHNDKLMLRAKGIARVTYFRIFNRWGELVFERNNILPNDINNAWDGKIRGKIGGPEVFVYTAEVICENGTSFVYKGNVSIIK